MQANMVMGVTERAKRAVGAWPTVDGLADRIVAELELAARTEPDAEKQSKLRATASYLAGAGRTILTDVMAKVIERSAGLS